MDPPHIQTSSLSLPWPHLVTICFHFPCPSLLSFIIPIIYPWTQGLTKFYAVRLIFPRPSGLHAMHSVSPHLQLRGLGPKWAAGRAGAAGASAAGTDLATIPTQAPTMHNFFIALFINSWSSLFLVFEIFECSIEIIRYSREIITSPALRDD